MYQNKVTSSDLMRYGNLCKQNTFETNCGVYTIRLIKYGGSFYFHTMKNGEVVEIKKIV